MRKAIKTGWLLFCMLMCAIIGHAQLAADTLTEPVAVESTDSVASYNQVNFYQAEKDHAPLTPRMGQAAHEIVHYKNSKDFQYKESAPQPSLLIRFLRWLFRGSERYSSFFNFLSSPFFWYTLFALFVITLIWIIFKEDIKALLYSNRSVRSHVTLDEHIEDIHAVDFNTRISDALKNRDYRLVIRLYYLLSLKLMDERRLIKWGTDKTNKDYLMEVYDTPHYKLFKETTYLFNLVWYGDIALDEEQFNAAREPFMKMNDTFLVKI